MAIPPLARHVKVSSLVILRRLLDGRYLSRAQFHSLFDLEIQRLSNQSTTSGGGDYYRSQISRAGKRFTQAVIISALEGHTLYRDAFMMLGVKKQATFNELAYQVRIAT